MSSPDGHPPTDSSRQSLCALNELLTSTRNLADTLKETAQNLHEDLDLSVSERTMLLELRKHGPMTVPALARLREVSRQFIHTTVNPLLAEGLLETRPNPAHRRSRLLALTDKGTDLILRVMRREGALMHELASEFGSGEIRQAAEILVRVQEVIVKQMGR